MAVEHLSHVYRSPQGQVEALADVSFQVAPQEFVCLVGPSGCGKSTLLRLMAGLLQPTHGQVCLDGQPLDRPAPPGGHRVSKSQPHAVALGAR